MRRSRRCRLVCLSSNESFLSQRLQTKTCFTCLFPSTQICCRLVLSFYVSLIERALMTNQSSNKNRILCCRDVCCDASGSDDDDYDEIHCRNSRGSPSVCRDRQEDITGHCCHLYRLTSIKDLWSINVCVCKLTCNSLGKTCYLKP